eukprot:scaffold13394_cov79-Phaeocystis_antarctica.AAC.3
MLALVCAVEKLSTRETKAKTSVRLKSRLNCTIESRTASSPKDRNCPLRTTATASVPAVASVRDCTGIARLALTPAVVLATCL